MHRPLFAILLALLTACSPKQKESAPEVTGGPVITPKLASASSFPDANALACVKCHEKEFADWKSSQHALANRLVDENDAAAFAAAQLKHGSFNTMFTAAGKRFAFAESFSNGAPTTFHAEAVIGIEPLRQYLVTAAGGRLQAQVVAYDPRSNDWFNAQGSEDRQPHEWGFWTNRSMTWNVQCAFCHMTNFKKNYDQANDSYSSCWTAMGISCAQCHPVSSGGAREQAVAATPSPRPRGEGRGAGASDCPVASSPHIATNRAMENCASCHARREEMTANFKAGENFEDHYRLTLPDAPTIYYADGQVHEEDFEYGSFMLSRMGHKGVTCFDCHNPHSGKLKLPAENNALCMQCHTPPGARGAIPVDIATHTHHAPGSAGNQCINCHMPVTHYMIRDPRRDHGFTIPDPELTLNLQIPNACNRCHTDKDAAWANEATKKWYGDKMDRPSRHRAYAITRAWNNDTAVADDLLALLRTEENPAWKATLISLAGPIATRPEQTQQIAANATNESALVRSAVVHALQGSRIGQPVISALRNDPSRLVRLDAAFATLGTEDFPHAMLAELNAYLDNVCDQPAGALRRAEFSLNLGRQDEAEKWARKAAAWDSSAEPQHILAVILNAVGKSEEALATMERAARLGTNSAAIHYDLALLYGEHNRPDDAATALQQTVAIEPRFGRAWYNLGLARAGQDKLDDALAALAKAEALMPESPEPPFAAATIYLRQNKKTEAAAAANRALKLAPDNQPALDLLRSLKQEK